MGASIAAAANCPIPKIYSPEDDDEWKNDHYTSLDDQIEKTKVTRLHPEYKPPLPNARPVPSPKKDLGFLNDIDSKEHQLFGKSQKDLDVLDVPTNDCVILESDYSEKENLEIEDPLEALNNLEDEIMGDDFHSDNKEEVYPFLQITPTQLLCLLDGELGIRSDDQPFCPLKFGQKFEMKRSCTRMGGQNTNFEVQKHRLKGTDLLTSLTLLQKEIPIEQNIDLGELLPGKHLEGLGITCLYLDKEMVEEVGSCKVAVHTKAYLILDQSNGFVHTMHAVETRVTSSNPL